MRLRRRRRVSGNETVSVAEPAGVVPAHSKGALRHLIAHQGSAPTMAKMIATRHPEAELACVDSGTRRAGRQTAKTEEMPWKAGSRKPSSAATIPAPVPPRVVDTSASPRTFLVSAVRCGLREIG